MNGSLRQKIMVWECRASMMEIKTLNSIVYAISPWHIVWSSTLFIITSCRSNLCSFKILHRYENHMSYHFFPTVLHVNYVLHDKNCAVITSVKQWQCFCPKFFYHRKFTSPSRIKSIFLNSARKEMKNKFISRCISCDIRTSHETTAVNDTSTWR